MHAALWLLQVLLGVYFILTGIVHFVVPPGLPAPMSWMYELPAALHYVSGPAEILGGLGLVLPGLLRTRLGLTPLAALGLVLVMVGAAVWHLARGEVANIGMNVVLGALAAAVAYGRRGWRTAAPGGPSRAMPA